MTCIPYVPFPVWDPVFIPCILSSVSQWLLLGERSLSFPARFPPWVTGAFPLGLGKGGHSMPASLLSLFISACPCSHWPRYSLSPPMCPEHSEPCGWAWEEWSLQWPVIPGVSFFSRRYGALCARGCLQLMSTCHRNVVNKRPSLLQ